MNKKEIKFETLHKKINVKNVVIGVLVVTLIVLVIVNRVSHAAYTSTLDVPLINGKINYKHPDFKMVSMHMQESSGSSTYNETNEMPSGSEYVINSSKSYCNKGSSGEKDSGVVLKTVNGNHVMNNLTKNDRCILYFDLAPLTIPDILAKYTKDNSRNGELNGPFTASTPTTVYSKEDDYGDSYVFAGKDPNNWVKMGDIYFRILRFNGNGSVRLIYSGTGTAQTNGTGTQIGTKAFNENAYDNMYVGLQYTSGEVHGTGTNSTILGDYDSADTETLYGWYNSNIKNKYGKHIDSAVGFCSDRGYNTNQDGHGSNEGAGTGTTNTYYGAFLNYYRGFSSQQFYTPTLKCENSADLLKLPVGLITADEFVLAGGPGVGRGVNLGLWLHTDEKYWTMSPSYFSYVANVFYIQDGTSLYTDDDSVAYSMGVRPVINLKSTTTFENNGADGSSSKPYVVKI